MHLSKRVKNSLSDYIYIVLGTALTAFGISVFMNPAKLAPGGVSGIGTIIYHTILESSGYNLDLGIIILILSLPLYVIGAILFGKEFGVKTLLGTLFLSLFTTLFDLIFPSGILNYSDPMAIWLCTLFTGITNGIGMGLVMRTGSNTGGTDIVAQIISRYSPLSLGSALFLVDGIIIFISIFVFGIENALLSIIVLILISMIIDKVIMPFGTNYAKNVFIISPFINEIGDFILKDLNRSGTIINAKGLFSKENKDMLMTTIPKKDITRLSRCVKEIDPNAFMVIEDTYHVLGEGYSPLDVLAENKDVTQK